MKLKGITKIEKVIATDPFNSDPSYLDQEGFEDRKKAYENHEFGFIGIYAKCSLLIDIGGGNTRIQEVQSGCLWGIESDSGEEYEDAVFADEKSELIEMLKALGVTDSMIEEAQ